MKSAKFPFLAMISSKYSLSNELGQFFLEALIRKCLLSQNFKSFSITMSTQRVARHGLAKWWIDEGKMFVKRIPSVFLSSLDLRWFGSSLLSLFFFPSGRGGVRNLIDSSWIHNPRKTPDQNRKESVNKEFWKGLDRERASIKTVWISKGKLAVS